MTENKSNKKYQIFVICFVIFNALATYLITTEKFNRYIIAFDYTVSGVINSFIGNVFFLSIIVLLTSLIFKTTKRRMITLLGVTFFLNAALFAINIFNRFYGTSFTFNALAIFKNPGDGFGLTLVFESLRELVTYYRVILFIPLILLLIIYHVYSKKNSKECIIEKPFISTRVKRVTIVLLLFFVNITVFINTTKDVKVVASAKATYATQNMGLYNYLVLDALGFDFDTAPETLEDIKANLDYYNKNKDVYINELDGLQYTKSPQLKDIQNISGSLVNNLNPEDSVTGILEDYNLVLVHLESLNKMLLEMPESNKYFYYLNAIMDQSYVFNNFYTNVGLGVSFDAELAIMTGLMPNGTSTIAWDYNANSNTRDFDFKSLPHLFKEKSYIATSFHGNSENFYNRDNVHPGLFGFDQFKGKETLLREYGYEDPKEALEAIKTDYNHNAGSWVTDRAVFDFVNKDITSKELANEQFMNFLITILPHTPFYYDPYHPNPKDSTMYEDDFIKGLDVVTVKYLNYIKHYNEMFRVMFEDVNGYGDDYVYNENNLYNRKKTAYVFYGDHGSGLKANDINQMHGGELETLEIRRLLLQTTSFIYVPGDDIVTSEISGQTVNIREGKLVGEQNLVRGQTDLHRTIVDLFNLPVNENYYLFGVHGMSSEPTYSLDNKTLDIITDEFFGSLRNSKNYIVFNNITEAEMEKLKESVARFKKFSDLAMNDNLYRDFKSKK